jgi:hypothetical protein
MKVPLFVALAMLLLACREPVTSAPEPLGTRLWAWVPDSSASIAHAQVCGSDLALGAIALDSAAWRNVWGRAFAGQQPQPPLPEVNFDDSTMVVMAVGEGSIDVWVDSIVAFERGGRLYLAQCYEYSPLPIVSCPAHFVRAPRVTLVNVARHRLDACPH